MRHYGAPNKQIQLKILLGRNEVASRINSVDLIVLTQFSSKYRQFLTPRTPPKADSSFPFQDANSKVGLSRNEFRTNGSANTVPVQRFS